MSWTSALAIYFIIWWLVLFVMLPFGVRNAHEAGNTVEGGHEAGAPVRHGLGWKAIVTTILATVVFAGVYWALTSGTLETLDIPFIKDMPKI